MRLSTILISLTLAAAAFAFVPSASAAQETCNALTSDACGGWVCVSRDSYAGWSDAECVSKRDIDRCQYQSDCCSSQGLWCPETEDS